MSSWEKMQLAVERAAQESCECCGDHALSDRPISGLYDLGHNLLAFRVIHVRLCEVCWKVERTNFGIWPRKFLGRQMRREDLCNPYSTYAGKIFVNDED